jgi:hypothetical protein
MAANSGSGQFRQSIAARGLDLAAIRSKSDRG